MSATLDGARVASLMPGATLIESEGRAFPVETRYLGHDPASRVEDEVARAIVRALAGDSGSILAFLPGQGEILRVAATLEERVRDPTVDVAPLYGAMDARAQDRAVAPAAKGRRKIVLATSIAETSLTIEGVRVVIDSGLMRAPRYEPDVGLTRLVTMRVSRANADQRRGRAGRVEPGVCYRLWEEAATGGLAPFAQPEILAADLSGLALDLAVWGVGDPGGLKFLDSPPRAAFKEARARCSPRSARSTPTAGSPTRATRSPAWRCRRDWRACWSTRRARARGTRRRTRRRPHRARPGRRRGRLDAATGELSSRQVAARWGRAAAGAEFGQPGAVPHP